VNPPRLGLNHASIAPYGAYTCGDGAAVLFSVQSEREWRAFCLTVLEDPALAKDPDFASQPDRVARRGALDARIDTVFSRLTREAVIARMEAAGMAYASLNTALDLAHHPHLSRVTVETPAGPVAVPAPPARIAGVERHLGSVPAVDEHGAAIRAEFGEGA
jgi:crotonobetainyl-CoA:carnitine CoA-transferase CaiB-like acyl-CoA transferase